MDKRTPIKSKHGTPLSAKIEQRTIKRDGCWGWTGSFIGGYPQVSEPFTRLPILVHRVRLAEKLGRKLAPGECALHTCDNPNCTNPDHLFLGSRADNIADKVAKGRQARQKGEDHGGSKLKEAQAIGIFNAPGTYKAVAAAFGVSWSLVGRIKRGEAWSHVTPHLHT